MNVYEILDKCKETLTQRGQQNGYDQKDERSFGDIAALFNEKTGADLSEKEAIVFMTCLKETRLKSQLLNGSGDVADTLVDLICYQALLTEAILKEHPKVESQAEPEVEPDFEPRRIMVKYLDYDDGYFSHGEKYVAEWSDKRGCYMVNSASGIGWCIYRVDALGSFGFSSDGEAVFTELGAVRNRQTPQ